ncbi:YceD family protein [Anaeromyxobacter paludicola]|uniref:DUF177 domain-containing protein n=1 Tax=Anaeromyxobacter paludicola TaxID=2918171 RepID=A0ABM7X523_9BACT|nr:DUF177 domain-containing protein [Anaeromyxobacter paludicola]BDG06912.1 hypothetical protein AMPC_00250 [Anaeromyxobacter paludicola]
MRVNIDEIKDAGLERSWDLTAAEVDEMLAGDKAGYRSTGPTPVKAHLDKVGRRVVLKAHAAPELTVPCGRCLQPVKARVPVDFELTLVPADEYQDDAGEEKDEEGQVAGSFEPEAVDEETYTGKVIDLDPMVREQLLLALPGYPVCRDDCKGLCPKCGANLNERDCGCDRHVPDPRWAGLEKFKK